MPHPSWNERYASGVSQCPTHSTELHEAGSLRLRSGQAFDSGRRGDLRSEWDGAPSVQAVQAIPGPQMRGTGAAGTMDAFLRDLRYSRRPATRWSGVFV